MLDFRYSELVHVSQRFTERGFPNSIEDWVWILLRFMESERLRPFFAIAPEYAGDYDVLKCVRRSLQDSSKKENRDKILVFESTKQNRFVSEQELRDFDPLKAVSIFRKVEAVVNIYLLEKEIASSFVPFLDLVNDLDSIIERFKSGEDNTTLREPLRHLDRKVGRRKLQAGLSSALALFSLYLLIEPTRLFNFIFNLGLGVILLIVMYLVSTSGIWESFPPLLEPTERTES